MKFCFKKKDVPRNKILLEWDCDPFVTLGLFSGEFVLEQLDKLNKMAEKNVYCILIILSKLSTIDQFNRKINTIREIKFLRKNPFLGSFFLKLESLDKSGREK